MRSVWGPGIDVLRGGIERAHRGVDEVGAQAVPGAGMYWDRPGGCGDVQHLPGSSASRLPRWFVVSSLDFAGPATRNGSTTRPGGPCCFASTRGCDITYAHASDQLLDHATYAVLFLAYVMAIYHECRARTARAWDAETRRSAHPSTEGEAYKAAMASYPYHEEAYAGSALMIQAMQEHGVADRLGRATMTRLQGPPLDRPPAFAAAAPLPVGGAAPIWPANAYMPPGPDSLVPPLPPAPDYSLAPAHASGAPTRPACRGGRTVASGSVVTGGRAVGGPLGGPLGERGDRGFGS